MPKIKVLHVRLDENEAKKLDELAKEIYGFDSAAELIRTLISYADTARPTLSRNFTPRKQTIERSPA